MVTNPAPFLAVPCSPASSSSSPGTSEPPVSPQTFACDLHPVPGVEVSSSPSEGYPPGLSVLQAPEGLARSRPASPPTRQSPCLGLGPLPPGAPLLSVTLTPSLCSTAPDARGSRGDMPNARKARWWRAQPGRDGPPACHLLGWGGQGLGGSGALGAAACLGTAGQSLAAFLWGPWALARVIQFLCCQENGISW